VENAFVESVYSKEYTFETLIKVMLTFPVDKYPTPAAGALGMRGAISPLHPYVYTAWFFGPRRI
jgi:hypothetical protein